MSEEKLLCTVTHRQIIGGCCPWCHAAIGAGNYTATPAGAETGNSPTILWNWPVLEDDLRAADAHVRHLASLNLAGLSHELERALPLIALALTDGDDEVRFHAEMACEQLGRDLSSDEATWLEGEIRHERHQLVARMMLLTNYFLASQPETRARRAGPYLLADRPPSAPEHCRKPGRAGAQTPGARVVRPCSRIVDNRCRGP